MRIMTLDKVKEICGNTNELVSKAINNYNNNPKSSNRLAIKNGTRKPRKESEQRVLDSFKLK